MEKEMLELAATAKGMHEKESATLGEARLLVKQAKEKAQQTIQKMTEECFQSERQWEEALLIDIKQEEERLLASLAQELTFYEKEYEENKETARKKLIKELYGYVYCQDERIPTDTA